MLGWIMLVACGALGYYFTRSIPTFLLAGKYFVVLLFVVGIVVLYNYASHFNNAPGAEALVLPANVVLVSVGIIAGLVRGSYVARSILKQVEADKIAATRTQEEQ